MAGTLGPEGQVAFSYGRPINRHPNRARRPKQDGRRGFKIAGHHTPNFVTNPLTDMLS